MHSFDFETYKFRAGELAPKIVCGSSAWFDGHETYGALHVGNSAVQELERLLLGREKIAFANAAFDLAVLAQARPDLLPTIFQALRDGRIHDVLIAEALNAIYHGTLGLDPETMEQLRSPSTRKPSKRYSLEIVTHLLTGRVDAKQNDVWRTSYALLDGIPERAWPEEAKKYPIDDALNTLEVALIQLEGKKLPHYWKTIPGVPGIVADAIVCHVCGQQRGLEASSCPNAERTPHRNLENLREQTEAAFALHLGAAWGLRTDAEPVERLAVEVEGKHKKTVARFQAKGWIRKEGDPKAGTEDTSAVKRVIAAAYGASGTCKRCGGVGRVTKFDPCRGEKIRGRFRGCAGDSCGACGGSGTTLSEGPTCKNVTDENGNIVENGCDGTGFDLDTAKMMPRSDKGGVKTDRDALMESGDDDLADYGENEHEKSLSTYLPYLRNGIYAPLTYSPNVLVATGRCSYEGSPIHQMPRNGKERECIRARGAWCGSPVEYVLASTDYAAGELCALAQVTYWYEGFSKMRDVINETKDPGALHTRIAAHMLGITLEECQKRIKEGDKQAKAFRQASKPASFGFPGGLGAATLVLTNRKKNAGTTKAPDGLEYAGIRFCILMAGAERCGVEKVRVKTMKGESPPICAACLKVVKDVLRPAFFEAYPEVKKYLDRISSKAEKGERIPSLVWNASEGRPAFIRERGGCGYTDGANQAFQGLMADIGKLAFARMTREGYLGIRADGTPSSLAGARFPMFLHDEPFAELPYDNAHVSAFRISEIMVEAGHELAPDVLWRADPALMRVWYKSAEPAFDPSGKLIPWEPKVEG